jgi:hypothetical protein
LNPEPSEYKEGCYPLNHDVQRAHLRMMYDSVRSENGCCRKYIFLIVGHLLVQHVNIAGYETP